MTDIPVSPPAAAPRTWRVRLERFDQLKHLLRVSGKIEGCAFDDGVIVFNPNNEYFHICQDAVAGNDTPDKHGYRYSWIRSFYRETSSGIFTPGICELYFEEETEAANAPDDGQPTTPVQLRRLSQLRSGGVFPSLSGTLGGLPLAASFAIARRNPDSLYVLNDVAGRGMLTKVAKDYLNTYLKPAGGKYKFVWMIPAVDDVLYLSPGTELFVTSRRPASGAAPKFSLSNPPKASDLPLLEETAAITRGGQCVDGLPIWVKSYNGTISGGILRKEGFCWYICTNTRDLDGSSAADKGGFYFSWSFTHESVLGLGDLKLYFREV